MNWKYITEFLLLVIHLVFFIVCTSHRHMLTSFGHGYHLTPWCQHLYDLLLMCWWLYLHYGFERSCYLRLIGGQEQK